MTNDAVRDMILTARMQAELAHAAYHSVDGVEAMAERYGTRWKVYRANHLEAAALFFSDHVHLVVCGTNDQYDWAINTSSSIQQLGICEVHKGFSDAAMWLAERLFSEGFAAYAHGRRLYLGGHSAGGAIAEMLPLTSRRLIPEATFTFGAPKWCESQSAPKYRMQPWAKHRFVMAYDPVPFLPLTLWRRVFGLRFFTHVTKAYQLTNEGIKETDTLEKIERAQSMARETITGTVANVIGISQLFYDIFSFPAHRSKGYFDALQSIAREYRV